MVLWGRSVLGRQKVPRKVPPRFHQCSSSFVVSLVLGQICLGLLKGSAVHQGSSTGAPRFHQGSWSFVVSLVLWGRSVLGCQKVPSKKVLWKVHPGSTNVSPRLRKFRDLSCFLGQIHFGVPRFCGSPLTSLSLSPRPSTLLCNSLNSASFGVFSHSKGLGAKRRFCLLGFFAKWLLPPKKFFGVFTKQFVASGGFWGFQLAILYCICLPTGCWLIFVLRRVPPTVLYI